MFKEKIIGYFKETVPKIHNKFDSLHMDDIRELAEYSEKTYNILSRVINSPKQKEITDLDFNIAMLLWRGWNTIIER